MSDHSSATPPRKSRKNVRTDAASGEAPELQCSACGDGRGPGDRDDGRTADSFGLPIGRPGALITEDAVTYYRYPLPPTFTKFRVRTAPITAIVLHYTGSPNQDPEVAAHYAITGNRQASYHFLVGRGAHATKIIQLVAEESRAWHAGNEWNNWSIGIEHAANDGESLDPVQEQTTIGLIKHLLRKYKLAKDAITGHRFTGTVTNCPGSLFGEPTQEAMQAWIDRNFAEFAK